MIEMRENLNKLEEENEILDNKNNEMRLKEKEKEIKLN